MKTSTGQGGSLPDEVTAVRAECRLLQVGGHEFVSVDLVNTATHGPPPPVQTLSLLELPRFLCATGAWICREKLVCKIERSSPPKIPTLLEVNQDVYFALWFQIDLQWRTGKLNRLSEKINGNLVSPRYLKALL